MSDEHLIKDCKEKKSVCSIRGFGEHHHADAHKFIVARRAGRPMSRNGSRYPVIHEERIVAHLLQSEIDRFSDQCIIWHQDIMDRAEESAMLASAASGRDASEEEEEFAGMGFFGEKEVMTSYVAVEEMHDVESPFDEDVAAEEDLVKGVYEKGTQPGSYIMPPMDDKGSLRYDLYQSPVAPHGHEERQPRRNSESTLLLDRDETWTGRDIESSGQNEWYERTEERQPRMAKKRRSPGWCCNPFAWIGSFLIVIGSLIGGSVNAAATDNVFRWSAGMLEMEQVPLSPIYANWDEISSFVRSCNGAGGQSEEDLRSTIASSQLECAAELGAWPHHEVKMHKSDFLGFLADLTLG